MPKILMTCIKEVVFAGKRHKPGDPLEARGESEARVMEALKKARRVTETAPIASAVVYNTRMMTAAAPAAPASLVVSPEYVIKVDGADVVLDGMDIDGLRGLCDRMGVHVHHLARETGMRRALVKSQAE